uniref:ARM repeat superfamily protein n=1 Tax=Araucaria cunninghamii TaxID=56994 RepID=A0A0D6R1H0_ARACU
MDAQYMEASVDPALLAAAASNFASYPGPTSDVAVKEFLDQFSLPVIFSTLESANDVPGLESSVVACLERIFKTSYGVSLLPHYMPYAKVGLKANSPLTRRLACKAVSRFLENTDKDEGSGVQTMVENDILPSIIVCLADGDESVAGAAAEAVENLAKSTRGLELLFPSKAGDVMHLKELAMSGSSLVRIRILATIAALFGISSDTAAAVYRSGLLSMFEQELNNTSDMLAILNALEVLYELAASPNGVKYLLTKNMLQRLASTISNSSVDSILRSRAIMISARLLSLDIVYSAVDELDVKNVIQAIDMDLEVLKSTESDEHEVALNALGQIGMVKMGAELLLGNTCPTARHVVNAVSPHQWRNIKLAGTHALASISGIERTQSTILLNDQAESCLRNLIYTLAGNSSKLSPSGLFLSLLQQEPEIRLAAYRLIAGLVTRSWCLWEVCSKPDIVNLVTDPHAETTKEGMELRHSCCVAINNSLMASDYRNDAAFSQVAEKLQVAVRNGPYLAKGRTEAKPIVITQERF